MTPIPPWTAAKEENAMTDKPDYTKERGQGIRFDCTECGDEVGPFEYYWRLSAMRRICEDCANLLGVGPHRRTEHRQ
jgi:hypothetical protein